MTVVLFKSEDAVFQINDGVSLRDISPYVTSVDGLPGAKELRDVTAFGASGHAWFPALENTVISLELLWSDDASVGPDTVFRLVRALTAATAWDCGPEGKASGDQKMSGTCWLKDMTTPIRVGDMIRMRVQLQVEGTVTLGTYT